MLRKFAGIFVAQHFILCMGDTNTELFHKKKAILERKIQLKHWNNDFSVELFTQLYYILCFVSCIPPLNNKYFLCFPFPLTPLQCQFWLSMTTAAPSEIGIITLHRGDNRRVQLSFRKRKAACLCSLLIIYLSVFLGTWPKGESCRLPPGVIVTASDDVCPQVSCNLIIYRGMSKEKISVAMTVIFDHEVLTLLL